MFPLVIMLIRMFPFLRPSNKVSLAGGLSPENKLIFKCY